MFNYYYKEYDYVSVLLKVIKIISFIEYCNMTDQTIDVTFAGTEHKKNYQSQKLRTTVSKQWIYFLWIFG